MEQSHRARRPGLGWVLGRSFVLGLVVLLTGSIAHVTSGGRLPAPLALLGLLLWASAAATPFATRRMGAPVLVLVAVGGQAACHGALSVMAGHVGDEVATGQSMIAHEWQHITEQGPLMVVGHLVASIAVGLVLAGEERNVWHLIDLLHAAARKVRLWASPLIEQALARLVALLGVLDRARPAMTAPYLLPRLADPTTAPIARRGPPTHLTH